MGDLVWVSNFFPKPLEKEFFSPTHNSKRFFSSIIQQGIFLFSAGYFFAQIFPCKLFIPSKSVCNLFFLKSPIPVSKAVMPTLPLLAGDLRFFASSPALPLWYINLPLFMSTVNIENLVKNKTDLV